MRLPGGDRASSGRQLSNDDGYASAWPSPWKAFERRDEQDKIYTEPRGIT